MLKYYKEFLTYEYSAVLQVIILLCSILFFVGLIYSVLRKPKNYYKDTSELPLQEDDEVDKFKI